MSLKNTGAALSDYAHGEVQSHPQFSSSSAATANSTSSSAVPVAGTQPPFDSLPLPPTPPPPPLQRAVSMPEFKSSKPESRPTDTIMEEEDEDEDNYEQSSSLKHRSSSHLRLCKPNWLHLFALTSFRLCKPNKAELLQEEEDDDVENRASLQSSCSVTEHISLSKKRSNRTDL